MKIIDFLPENFKSIAHHLSRGLPSIIPTETCYGFSGDIFSLGAIQRVEEIKGRQDKPFLILVPSFDDIQQYADIPQGKKERLQALSLEKPTSFVLPKVSTFPSHYFPDFLEVGIRVCGYKPLFGFFKIFSFPIFSTSANKTGFPEIYDPEEIQKYFGNIPDILFVNAGMLPCNKPSRIIRVPLEGEIEVIRE